MDKKQEYERCRQLVEDRLHTYFTGDVPQKELFEAMRYSLLAGGKRIRPVMLLKFAEAVGGNMEKALPLACAMEMVHTYSLIHDDLPCMDDDELRRGKKTNHVVFGVCTATLAGDALQAAAFEAALGADLPPAVAVRAAGELAFAAGENGICGGQILDMQGEGKKLGVPELTVIHDLKTAAMIRAAARMGVIAGGGTEEQLTAATVYADAVGLAFQVRDDILDVTSTPEELGKPVHSDAESEKSTFAAALGIPQCEALIEEKTEEAVRAVTGRFRNEEFFVWLAELLAKRVS